MIAVYILSDKHGKKSKYFVALSKMSQVNELGKLAAQVKDGLKVVGLYFIEEGQLGGAGAQGRGKRRLKDSLAGRRLRPTYQR